MALTDEWLWNLDPKEVRVLNTKAAMTQPKSLTPVPKSSTNSYFQLSRTKCWLFSHDCRMFGSTSRETSDGSRSERESLQLTAWAYIEMCHPPGLLPRKPRLFTPLHVLFTIHVPLISHNDYSVFTPQIPLPPSILSSPNNDYSGAPARQIQHVAR